MGEAASVSVRLETDDSGIACITLSDPDTRNALSAAMAEQLGPVLADVRSSEIRCVIVTGEPPAFSAGGDLGMLEEIRVAATEGGVDATARMHSFYNAFLDIGRLPVPVIAAVNGHAVGAGLCLAMACDVMIVAHQAKVGVNFARLGLHPGMGATWWLPERVGPARAFELLVTGRLISGTDAAAYGLALEAVPAADVMPRARAMALEIAGNAPQVVRQLKRMSRLEPTGTPDGHLHAEAANQAENFRSADLAEGLRAARERRAAAFVGR
jgi:enoyl-CoA hydratase/carnithine racemase